MGRGNGIQVISAECVQAHFSGSVNVTRIYHCALRVALLLAGFN
jgi:hypothetical protein